MLPQLGVAPSGECFRR